MLVHRIALVIAFFSHSVLAQSQNMSCQWAVIGAGPAGIAMVGALLDHGVKEKEIVWIDPTFQVGDLGALYQNVPSNTMVRSFRKFFLACRAFDIKARAHQFELFKRDDGRRCPLKEVVDPLLHATQKIKRRVNVVQGTVNNVARECDVFVLTAGDCVIRAKKVVLAIGAHPKQLQHRGLCQISMNDALDKQKLRELVCPDDIVAVFGVSHSGMLVLKNLSELGVKKIVSFAKKPLCYAVVQGAFYINAYTGLKGVAAQWARDFFEKNLPNNLVKFFNASGQEIEQELAGCTKVIYAIGFERNAIGGLPDELLQNYDTKTGVIAPNLFGVGIAFPRVVRDFSGEQVQAIGIWEFLRQARQIARFGGQTS